jgi:hypothetical protein
MVSWGLTPAPKKPNPHPKLLVVAKHTCEITFISKDENLDFYVKISQFLNFG